MVPQNNYNNSVKDVITDHHNIYNNEKVSNTVTITKMCHRDANCARVVGKMAPIDLLNIVATNFQCVKRKKPLSAVCNKVKHNKMKFYFI